MTSPNLFNPPARYTLPLSKGQDLVVDFQSKDSAGNPADYAPGAIVTLVLDTATPVTATATVNSDHAICYLPYTDVDQIPPSTVWRVVATIPGGTGTPPTIETVLANGTVARFDGR